MRPRRKYTESTWRRSIFTRSARSIRSSISWARPLGWTCWVSTATRPVRCRQAAAGSRRHTGECPCRRPARPNCFAESRWPNRWSMARLTTPTGAAILTTVVERFSSLPAAHDRVDRAGRGHARAARAGQYPPVVRGDRRAARRQDRVWVLETNLDDLPGEVVGYTMTRAHGGRCS